MGRCWQLVKGTYVKCLPDHEGRNYTTLLPIKSLVDLIVVARSANHSSKETTALFLRVFRVKQCRKVIIFMLWWNLHFPLSQYQLTVAFPVIMRHGQIKKVSVLFDNWQYCLDKKSNQRKFWILDSRYQSPTQVLNRVHI